jgi:hypothetical protein
MKIITQYRNPPIPVRDFDWCAYFEGPEDWVVGSGRTELAAVADLYSLFVDQEDAPGHSIETFLAFRDAFDKALDSK